MNSTSIGRGRFVPALHTATTRARNRLLVVLFVAAFAGLVAAPALRPMPAGSAPTELPTGDRKPRLAIVSAFPPELSRLVAEARITRTQVLNGRTFYVGELRGNDVVMFLTGISMVNAAMMTEAALSNFNVTGIVLSGIAGGVNPELNIGDVTVPRRWAQYQEHLFARQTSDGAFAWDTGFHTNDFGNFGMMFPQYVSVASETGPPDVEERKFWFDADPTMLSVAHRVAGRVELQRCTRANLCLENEPRVVVGGSGVSGSTFVDNASYREWVSETFDADALDMESAAVAHVAYTNAVPMIAFRSLSDLAGGGPAQNELSVFFQLAADNAARVVTSFLEQWRNEAGRAPRLSAP